MTTPARTGSLLLADTADRYTPLGAFGQPVYLSHVQLKAAVRQKLGPAYADLFARPDRDPRSGSIRWLADPAGPAVRWTDLPPDQQVAHAMTIAEMRSGFARYIADLRGVQGQGAGQAQAFANLLDHALKIPDDSHLFLVGDQPVAAFWGFSGGGPAFEALSVAPAARPVEPPPPPPAAPVEAAPVTRPAPRWWRWLAALLLALLLLALLLFGMRACDLDYPGFAPFGADPAPTGPAVEEPAPEPAVPPAAPADPAAPLGVVPGTVVPGDGVAVPPAGVAPPVGVVVPDGATDSGTMGAEGTDAPEDAPPPSADAPPPEAEAAPPPPPPQDTPPEPPAPDAPPPDAPPPDAPSPDAPPPADAPSPDSSAQPPAPPPPGPELAIPEDSPQTGKLDFLEGTWDSRQGLVERGSGQPLQQYYQFDGDGRGETVVRRPDGTECRAPAQAAFDGSTLKVEEQQDLRCPDGATYQRSQTECRRQADGQTVCTGTNADGTTFRVGIERRP